MDTDLVITFAQQQTYWLGLTATQWISIAAAIITLGIMVAALLQWRSSNKAHKQSHTPILRSDLNEPSPGKNGTITLSNKGLGPALLQEINITHEGEVVEGQLYEACEKIFALIGEKVGINIAITGRSHFQKGYPIGQGETIQLVKLGVTDNVPPNLIKNAIISHQIKIQVVYLDMFGDRHEIWDPWPERSL
ncbi:hypothetical protein KZO85_12725 [Chromohalobacter canadensis]|uniref:hypothetical protein n=1 Tax=Chromohalobacter canadensis TaxID=141389 RepID=UPI0021C1F926|nr:hypothetical protein [Chromohalobacter canadensis]MCT8469450.1 hypothetical protein [Chromohalobacter canadensis]MCT8472074.1 hypothetical protein [Chromohalobacter canadensis]MCT8499813.1 hypothetical protein [Chromohalobacter canadensis]